MWEKRCARIMLNEVRNVHLPCREYNCETWESPQLVGILVLFCPTFL